jgi:hypothetical protein
MPAGVAASSAGCITYWLESWGVARGGSGVTSSSSPPAVNAPSFSGLSRLRRRLGARYGEQRGHRIDHRFHVNNIERGMIDGFNENRHHKLAGDPLDVKPDGAIAVSDTRLTNDEARRISKLISRLPERCR